MVAFTDSYTPPVTTSELVAEHRTGVTIDADGGAPVRRGVRLLSFAGAGLRCIAEDEHPGLVALSIVALEGEFDLLMTAAEARALGEFLITNVGAPPLHR